MRGPFHDVGQSYVGHGVEPQGSGEFELGNRRAQGRRRAGEQGDRVGILAGASAYAVLAERDAQRSEGLAHHSHIAGDKCSADIPPGDTDQPAGYGKGVSGKVFGAELPTRPERR